MGEQKEKQEEHGMRAGQFWIRGTVEDFGPVTRGSFTANILRVFVPNERAPKYPDTFFIRVLDKAAERMAARVGDNVEVSCYATSRLNRSKDGAFADFTMAFCRVLRPSERGVEEAGGSATESGTREVPAPKAVEDDAPLPF